MFTAIKNTFTKVKAALINDGTGVKDRIYPSGKRQRLIAVYLPKAEEKPTTEAQVQALQAELKEAKRKLPEGWVEVQESDYPFIVEETKFENSEKLKYLRTVDESMGKRIEEIVKEN